jgi:hypothetical protein
LVGLKVVPVLGVQQSTSIFGGSYAMNRFGEGNNSSPSGRLLVITSQLYNAAMNMHHIDELFQWLSDVIMQNFDGQGIQFWALQATRTDERIVQLRCMVHREQLFPTQIIANNQVATVASQIIRERLGNGFEKVEKMFPHYQASLLARYGLAYCGYYFLSGDMLLPPFYNATSGLELPTPFAVAVLHFLRQPASSHALTSINLVLEQAISVAVSHGLFMPKGTTFGKLPSVAANSLGRQPQLRLDDLIPQRIEDANVLKSSNPLSGSIVIADKKARRLFAAIDGQKNLSELRSSLDMDVKEAYQALQILVAQHRIQLFEPGGEQVDRSVFLDNL